MLTIRHTNALRFEELVEAVSSREVRRMSPCVLFPKVPLEPLDGTSCDHNWVIWEAGQGVVGSAPSAGTCCQGPSIWQSYYNSLRDLLRSLSLGIHVAICYVVRCSAYRREASFASQSTYASDMKARSRGRCR